MVGYATLVLAATRRLWRSAGYWTAIAAGAATSLALTIPFFIPFLRVQKESGFARSIEDTARWAAKPNEYLISSARAHAWLLAYARTLGPWGEVLFPGVIALALGAVGIAIAARRRSRRSRDGAPLWLARRPGVLVVVRPGRRPLPRPLLPAGLLVPARAVAPGTGRGPVPGGVRRDRAAPTIRGGARPLPRRARRGGRAPPRSPTSPSFRSAGPARRSCRRLCDARAKPARADRGVSVLRRAHRVPAPRAVHALLDVALDAAWSTATAT